MPIPETPYTRKEAYLNAIATGDSSGIPETPYTREEMYLDYIARNGGGGGGGGSTTLAGLTDVDISNPSDGQTLVYDATNQKWVNGSGAGGGNVLVVNVIATHTTGETTATFDKTFAELKSAYEEGAVILCQVSTEDNVNGVYGNNIAFLNYRPAAQLPFPSPEAFYFEATFLQIGNDVHGCFVNGEINATETFASIVTAQLTAS